MYKVPNVIILFNYFFVKNNGFLSKKLNNLRNDQLPFQKKIILEHNCNL